MVNKKRELVTGEIYHVFNRSIARYQIFNNDNEYGRMIDCLLFFRVKKQPIRLDRYLAKDKEKRALILRDTDKLIQVIAYCLMPTHIHLVVKQLLDDGISVFMSNVQNSYARYFNTKHGRKGPLWESKFKDAHVKNDEQLLHLTRYVHINPTTSYLVDKPEEWKFSSYCEYIGLTDEQDRACCIEDIMDIGPDEYRSFVDDNVDYQRSLANIKKLMLE